MNTKRSLKGITPFCESEYRHYITRFMVVIPSSKIFLFTGCSYNSLPSSYFPRVSPFLCTKFSFCLSHLQMSFFGCLPFLHNLFFLLFHFLMPAVPVHKIFPWAAQLTEKLLKTQKLTEAENHNVDTFLNKWCFGQWVMKNSGSRF